MNIRELFNKCEQMGINPGGIAINAYDNRTCRIAGKLSRNSTPAATGTNIFLLALQIIYVACIVCGSVVFFIIDNYMAACRGDLSKPLVAPARQACNNAIQFEPQ